METIAHQLGNLRKRLAGKQVEQEKIRQTLNNICERWFALSLNAILVELSFKQKVLTLKLRNKVFAQELTLRQTELLAELKSADCLVERVRCY